MISHCSFAWLHIAFKEKFLCTLNGKFTYGGAAQCIDQANANRTDRKIEVLREQPPKVAHLDGAPLTIGCGWDSGKVRLATTERPNMYSFVTRSIQKRSFLGTIEKFKLVGSVLPLVGRGFKKRRMVGLFPRSRVRMVGGTDTSRHSQGG